MNNENIRVPVGFWSASDTSWNLLVDQRQDKQGFYRSEWFPKKICRLEKIEPKDPTKELPKYFLTAPKWLLDKKKVYYSIPKEEPKDGWKFALLDEIKEATELRAIRPNMKAFAKDLIENTDSKFILVYSGSHMEYRDIMYREGVSQKTLAFILKNYGIVLYKKIKNNKRLF